MRVIHSTKVAWAVAKEADVVTKAHTEVIMAIKSRGKMGIVSIGVAEVLGPVELTWTKGTGGSNYAGNGLVDVGTVDAGM